MESTKAITPSAASFASTKQLEDPGTAVARNATLPDEDEPRQGEEVAVSGDVVRFHVVPCKGWDERLRAINCDIRNVINWKGRRGEPPAPPHPCWLLPASDTVALQIAERADALRARGWRVLTSKPRVIQSLGDKASLWKFADEAGLAQHLPRQFFSPDDACYPCILKSATGDWGKDCHIVGSKDEVLMITKDGFGTKWVLQELIVGSFEQSVSMLMNNGEIISYMGLEYEYDRDVYVSPRVKLLSVTPRSTPKDELAVMRTFLREYRGICNFNYKVLSDGSMRIFEINVRVGGDLACDAPREAARAIFQAFDGLEEQNMIPASPAELKHEDVVG